MDVAGPQRIALLISPYPGYNRQILLGIHAYSQQAKHWLFHNAQPTPKMLQPLGEWNPHGIIAQLNDEKIAREIIRLGKPVVDTAMLLEGLKVPTVDVDHEAVGRLAADYFLTRGYRHFGYFGSGRKRYSCMRLAGFQDTVERAGFEVHSCHIEYMPYLPEQASWKSVDTQVGQWLTDLSKPVAVLAANDVPAHELADMCQLLGLRVPNEVAILGVDDDELECQLAFSPLSSVAIPAQRIGFEAAKLLDRLLAGERVANQPMYFPPIRIVTRQSTSTFAVDEPTITAALHYIRNHFAQPLLVSTIAAALTVRRQALEEKFRTLLGESVLDEIHRVRVDKAKELLASTDLPISMVTKQSGFSTPQRMAVIFRKATGMAPSEYRCYIHARQQP